MTIAVLNLMLFVQVYEITIDKYEQIYFMHIKY